MLRIKERIAKVSCSRLLTFMPLAFLAMWSLVFVRVVSGQEPRQTTFSSPVQASEALFRAAQANDATALLKIFGSDGKEMVNTGNAVEDKADRDQFVRKYKEMRRLAEEPDGTVRLYVGAENWPLPVPLASQDGRWYFDAGAGKQEITFREIGRNEIATIRVLRELVDAQKEYYAKPGDGGVKQYAQKLDSDAGKHNGLYWQTQNGESESPIGPHLASAAVDGDGAYSRSAAKPFGGYYFRVLTRQGEHAPGGAKNCIVDGKMTEGFAFLAYPAQYRVSGVMTFIVGQDGVIYQKDLGPNTPELANAIREYNPDEEWVRVEQTANTRALEEIP
jgi:hypothetical protein